MQIWTKIWWTTAFAILETKCVSVRYKFTLSVSFKWLLWRGRVLIASIKLRKKIWIRQNKVILDQTKANLG